MSKQKKYEMVRELSGRLFNIRALRDIPEHDVRKGDWGGRIQNEENLSQDGTGWVMEEAMVTGEAQIIDGLVTGRSHVKDYAIVHSGTIIDSEIGGASVIKGESSITKSKIFHSCANNVSAQYAQLYSVHITDRGRIFNSIISAVEGLEIKQTIDIKNSQIRLEDGVISSIGNIENVKINVKNFTVNVSFKLEHIRGSILSNLWIKSQGNMEKRTEWIGKKEEPILIEGKHLLSLDSNINGGVTLRGNLRLINSNISENAQVDMYGTLVNCHISEWASIKLSQKVSREMSGLVLNGDSIVND
ncbi:hypothetical protein JMA_39120 (plasmid) [Jeotgalibacillus malaysiensis]|uniref:Uncharacterized protein n=1 Tax=Jeotgalibacillus malaysiensis TaxID=1508404 RepID=A0A0B5ASP4_9BACL|nr:hypothetical protein [Jeotgalibacillus malaysiensis]AJD93230.1 hypothetical protein JMA_39120 [Jeotgalibacillus malaysiensis]